MSHLSSVPSDPDELRAWLAARGLTAAADPQHGVRTPATDRRSESRKRRDRRRNDQRPKPVAIATEQLERVRPRALATVSRLSPEGEGQALAWIAEASRRSLTSSDLEELTAPYRTLLSALGEGVQLTESGHLPAELVPALCSELGIPPHLVRDPSSEDDVRPLRVFLKLVKDAGLVRSAGGFLKPTAAAVRCMHVPERLWTQVAGRLPAGRRDLEVDVEWLALIAMAGGVPRLTPTPRHAVHELCVDAGWGRQGGKPMNSSAFRRLVEPTEAALVGPGYNMVFAWPSWAPAAAASVVLTPPGASSAR